MPFKSEKQRKWMHANEPDMAKRWEKEEKVEGNWPDEEELQAEASKRDYKDEYKKFQSSDKSKKYRAELNKYNRKKGTYGNGDGKDASHKGGKISGFEKESVNRGRREKSRLKKEQKLREAIRRIIREDFAGAYPEHQRKKFDGKRRKQSEVLGYKLTGVDDVRTEIDDATVKEHAAGGLTYKKGKTVMVTHKTSGKELMIIDKPNVRKEYEKIGYFVEGKINESVLKNLIREIMYTMGAGGLQAIETGVIHLEKNSVYYMGASSSPDQIIITKVDDNYLEYIKPIFNNSKKMKIERPIGESLILDGSNTWLKTYGRFKENKKIADTLQKNLNGKKGPNNGKVSPSEYDRYVLTIKGTKGSNDVYGAAKQWGVIGPWNGKSGEEAEVELEVYKIYIPYVKKDKQLKITKQKKGEL